ncbi:MAG: pilus assembly protein PilM [Sedimentisphaerales bacterium]|nr:pilus assembly protein PilM [Sedimentisphaerales bacterium]
MISWGFKTREMRPIGLDIGHNSIKMIQLAINGEQITVHAADEARVEPVSNGDEQTRRDAVVSAIKQILARGNFHGTKVVSCLPSGDLKITSVRLTETEGEKTEQALRREVVQRFGLDPDKDAMDYIVAGNVRQGDEIKNELILFATNNDIVKSHIEMLEMAGLRPIAIDTIPCALFRSFERSLRRQEDKEHAVIFIDVGSCYTTVVFTRGGEICFVKQIKVGAGNFNREVGSKLGISNSEAEILRGELQAESGPLIQSSDTTEQELTESGRKIDASTRQVMVDGISKIAEELAHEISLCLRYYTVTFRGRRIERAILTGGGGYEKILLDVMQRQMTVKIEVAQPLRGFDLSNKRANLNFYGDRRGLLCEWAVAVGLSLKGWRGYGTSQSGSGRRSPVNYNRRRNEGDRCERY